MNYSQSVTLLSIREFFEEGIDVPVYAAAVRDIAETEKHGRPVMKHHSI